MLKLTLPSGLLATFKRFVRVPKLSWQAPSLRFEPGRITRARILQITRGALAYELAALAGLAVVAFVFADPHAGETRVLIRFDRDAAAIHRGLGETAHIAPTIDAAVEPFTERSPFGPLPKVAADGRTPAQNFARTGTAINGRPVISIVVTGLGLDEGATRDAIAKLPRDITLAFSPYSGRLSAFTDLARTGGREYLLEAPVEPFDYPESDPGPLVLLADAAPIANLERLHHTLARGVGYFGVLTSGAARFATMESAIAPIAADLAARGLVLVDDGKAPVSKTPRIARQSGALAGMVDRRLDLRPTDEGLALALLDLERLAVEQGHAIGATELYPVVLNRLPGWAAGLAAKGLVLEPVSVQILPSAPAAGAEPSDAGKHAS